MRKEHIILLASTSISIFLLFFLLFSFKLHPTALVYVLPLCGALALMPYFLYVHRQVSREKKMEDHFPDFLRDLAEARRVGMTLVEGVRSCAAIDYGPLTPEIKRMATQLSWGISFPEAMKSFYNRIRYSEHIKRGIAVIMESFYAGGDIASAMDAVADGITRIREVEKEREAILSQQTLIIYVIFFIFLGILIALYRILIPMTALQVGEAPMLGGIGAEFAALPAEHYKMLFFLALLIQAICSGLIAGETREGKIVAGAKHVGILLPIAMICFFIFIYPVLFTIEVLSTKTELLPGESFKVSGRVLLEGRLIENVIIELQFAGTKFMETTNEKGEFAFELVAPEQRGDHEILLLASYGEHEAQTRIQVRVR